MLTILGFPWLETLSAMALAGSLLIYVLLDGTDLGAGILTGFQRSPQARQDINLSLLPVWDGNETWLVLAAGGLLGLFPLAYGIVLSALYIPLFVMMLALVMRGMAIEFRPHAPKLFDTMLISGSLLTALAQGVVVGALMQGIATDGQQFTGSAFGWLRPFPLYCGVALAVGYAWLGAGWLLWRMTGELRAWARRVLPWLALVSLLMVAVLLMWCAQLQESWRQHLLNPYLWGPSLAGMALFVVGLRKGREFLPLLGVLVMVSVAFCVLAFTLFPWIVPPHLTLSQAAAPPTTQKFLLISYGLLVPVTLLYNTWGFRLFSGKIGG